MNTNQVASRAAGALRCVVTELAIACNRLAGITRESAATNHLPSAHAFGAQRTSGPNVTHTARGTVTWLLAACCLVFPPLSWAQQTNCVQCPSGVIAWWPGDGSTTNLAGSGNGSLQGGVTYAAGKVGQSFDYNGTNAYVEVADSPRLALPGGMTIAMWVMPSVPLSEQRPFTRFVSKNDGELGQHGWQIITTGSQTKHPTMGIGKLLFECYDNAGNGKSALTAEADLLPNHFSHLAATYDHQQGEMVIYVNGAPKVRSSVGVFQIPNVANPLCIGWGNWSGGEEFFHGRIDEVVLFNRGLSSNEIAAVYAAGSNGLCMLSAPLITRQPASKTVAVGDDLSVSVEVGSGGSCSGTVELHGRAGVAENVQISSL